MYPVLLKLGSFEIRSYGVMAAIGFLLACFIVNLNRKYAKINSDQVGNITILAIVAGIIGARIFYVTQYFDNYKDNLLNIFRVDQGGLVFYGGFILSIIAIIVYCKLKKIDYVRVLDIFTPALAVAHACGRIGCYFNGCCYGKLTDVAWGVVYPPNSEAGQLFGCKPVHPVQLYEAAEQLLLFGLYFYLVRKMPRGIAMSVYLITYGILRFLNELLRADNPKWIYFTPAQWIGLGLIPLGLIMLIYFIKNARKNA